MWKKLAISIGKQYVFEILKLWLSEKGKKLGKKDVRNIEDTIKTLSLVLAANEDITVLDIALLNELGGNTNV